MTNLRLPSRIFYVLNIEDMRRIKVELIPPSIWVKEKDPIGYSNMSKEEEEVLDEYILWKVIHDGEVTYMSKEALKPFFEKTKEAEKR